MTLSNRREISLDEEAKTGLLSLVKQSAQVGAGLLGLLLLTGGNPPAYLMALSVFGGIGFVAWQEKHRYSNNTQQLTKRDTNPNQQEEGLENAIKTDINSNQLEKVIEDVIRQIPRTGTSNFAEQVKIRGLNPASDFIGASLIEANLVHQDLRNFSFKKANLQAANLSNAGLSDADLSDANLSGANLSGAYLKGSYLQCTYLKGANLRDVDLIAANLSGADLRDANLSGANLRDANLSGANLIETDLSGADLSFANLLLADLSGADLSGTIVEDARFIDVLGISETLKQDLRRRGAIFQDNPPSREPSFSPRSPINP